MQVQHVTVQHLEAMFGVQHLLYLPNAISVHGTQIVSNSRMLHVPGVMHR